MISKTFFFGGIAALSLIAVAAWQMHMQLAYAKPVGVLHTEPHEELQDHANAFMENAHASVWTDGRENNHCSSILYGYDETYVYAWMYCASYMGSTAETLTLGTASSGPARFTYVKPDFTITAVDEAKDGNLYEPSIRKLFPKVVYAKAMTSPSPDDLDALSKETRAQAQAQLFGSAFVSPTILGNEHTSAEVDLNNDGVKEAIVLTLGTRATPSAAGRPTTLRVNEHTVNVPGGCSSRIFWDC